MNKINYQKELEKTLENITKSDIKHSLFLHVCCAPCSSYVLEYLNKYFNITAL
ncbi:MAG: epoxyqueuosine reductase QueH, partial [Eubacterium ventriosum]